MGNACCARSTFTSLNSGIDSSQFALQLRERPDLLCNPKPSVLLSLHDSALHFAAEHKATDVARQIFSFLAGADPETLQAALLPYCRRKHLPAPNTFAAAGRMASNMTNNKGQTPLMFACYSDCPEMVKLLLEQGADPWVGDNCGCRNALHYAAMAGSSACVEALMKNIPPHMLVRQGVRYINARSLSGLTPLHYGVFFNHEGALKQLLLHEPNINAATTGESYDTYGSYDIYSTPLHFAALQDSTPIARLLLLHYARRRRLGTLLDPRMRANSAGKLPWQVARNRALATMLHPSAPLAEVLGREGEEALLGLGGADAAGIGPPALAALAAAALRQKLLAAVEIIERECVEEAALQRKLTSRPTGLLLCSTPRRSGGAAAAAAGTSCGPGPRDLFRLGSRARSRRPVAPGSVMPVSPRRAPTLDRMPHPTDGDAVSGYLPTEASGALLRQRSRGVAPPSPVNGDSGNGTRPCGSGGAPQRGRPTRGPSGRVRAQQQQQQSLSGFLGSPGGGGGGGVPAAASSGWISGGGTGGNAQTAEGALPLGVVNLRSTSLSAGPHPFASGAATVLGLPGDGDPTGEMRATLPGGASPLSPHHRKHLAEAPSPWPATPVGGSPPRDGRSGGLFTSGGVGSVAAGFGSPDDAYPMAGFLSPAVSLVAGSCVGFDAAAAAAVAATGGGAAAAATSTADELCGVSGGDNVSTVGGDDDEDDGTCNVCFARPEAVMSAVCRHGLCTACAGELCRALVSKPLLCPFCRRPVGSFVRVVRSPANPP